VLKRLDLEIGAGEALLVTGPNGSGKTTLLRCLATALRPHEGHVRLDGQDLWRTRGRLRDGIGFLSHATRLYEDLSARDNLAVWARLGGLAADPAALLARVGLPADRRDPVRTFSAGMRRRLALAVTLLKQPRLMLLDEPFTALDPEGRALVGGVLDDLRRRGTTVVLTSHRPEEAAPYCTAAAHLDDGRIRWRGAPAEAGAHA
jgi:heme exporter protein A